MLYMMSSFYMLSTIFYLANYLVLDPFHSAHILYETVSLDENQINVNQEYLKPIKSLFPLTVRFFFFLYDAQDCGSRISFPPGRS